MTAEPASTSASQNWRARKKLATRQALAWQALQLALEHGIDNVTVDQIAAAGQVSPRTFNNYFGNKYQAICSIMSDRAQSIETILAERPADEPIWQSITAAVLHQYETVGSQNNDEAAIREGSIGSRELFAHHQMRGEYLRVREIMHETLATAIAARIGSHQAMLPRIMASAVLTATDVSIARWHHSERALHEVLRETISEAAAAIVLPDGAASPGGHHDAP